MTQKIKVTVNEALDEFCNQCKAPVGMMCTYVHPKDWSYDNQQMFFNKLPLDRQQVILRRAGEYTKQPHHARFETARATKRARLRDAEQAKIYNWATQEPGYADIYEQPMLSWDLQPPVENVDQITFKGVIFRPPKYIDKVLAEARSEWENEVAHRSRLHTEHMKGYREGHHDGFSQGVEEGLRRAINMIATGSEEGD